MAIERHLDWADCRNVRDLGGLPTRDGRTTRWRGVVRADNLDRLTPPSWAALHAYGVRTVIDLREDDERLTPVARPAGVAVVHVPLDDNADVEFWSGCADDDLDDATPMYYQRFIERKAERCVAAVAAVARAAPGGVVVHCGLGRDRTGLVALLLLALAGVTPEAIVEDYALSGERLKRRFTSGDDPVVARLALRGTTIAAVLGAVLGGPDLGAHLLGAGLTPEDLDAVRARLLSGR